MTERLLAVPDGYDPSSQAIVGLMAAGLDDQSRRLRETVAGLEVEHLEWQERPGRSTIGMLMAHLAASEIGYFYVACAGVSYQDAKPVIHEHLGIDWDGVLVGTHATNLKGRDLDGYLDLLARARRATHELLKTWDDLSLGRTLGGAGTGMTISQHNPPAAGESLARLANTHSGRLQVRDRPRMETPIVNQQSTIRVIANRQSAVAK